MANSGRSFISPSLPTTISLSKWIKVVFIWLERSRQRENHMFNCACEWKSPLSSLFILFLEGAKGERPIDQSAVGRERERSAPELAVHVDPRDERSGSTTSDLDRDISIKRDGFFCFGNFSRHYKHETSLLHVCWLSIDPGIPSNFSWQSICRITNQYIWSNRYIWM